MRVDRKYLLLGVSLSGALCVLAAGCGNPQTATTVGTQIDDTVITTKVKSALLADPEVKSFELKVETRKGAVQLSGFVDSLPQIERALSATRAVAGVSSVENNISVKAGIATVGNNVDDGIVTGKVKAALLADPNVKSLDIAVATSKGTVQLSGYVDNQSQIDGALNIARNVEGVSRVDNEMSIKK